MVTSLGDEKVFLVRDFNRHIGKTKIIVIICNHGGYIREIEPRTLIVGYCWGWKYQHNIDY